MRHALYTTSSVFSAIFVAVLAILVLAGLVHASELPNMTATSTTATSLPTISPVPDATRCFSLSINLGMASRDGHADSSVKALQQYLKETGYFKIDPTGYFGALTQAAVIGFQKDHGVPGTGYVGPLTRKAFESIHCVPGTDRGNYPNANKNISISVATDKSTYSQADDITITITAKNATTTDQTLQWSSGCATSYSIGTYDSRTNQICTQMLAALTLHPGDIKTWTMTYSHGTANLQEGVYQVIGRINTIGEARTPINIVAQTAPFGVTSPNGGETWVRGTQHNITWKYVYPVFSALGSADLSLVPYVAPCHGTCPMYMLIIKPYTLATGTPISGGSLSWIVGSTLEQGRTIPDGEYRIQICASNTDVCDTSNEPFTIVTATSATSSQYYGPMPYSGGY